jgi:hypothetical protein
MRPAAQLSLLVAAGLLGVVRGAIGYLRPALLGAAGAGAALAGAANAVEGRGTVKQATGGDVGNEETGQSLERARYDWSVKVTVEMKPSDDAWQGKQPKYEGVVRLAPGRFGLRAKLPSGEPILAQLAVGASFRRRSSR